MSSHTKGFDPDLSSSTLPFEGDEKEVSNNHNNDIPIVSNPPHDISRSSGAPFFNNFIFTEDHNDLLNGHINSFTSFVGRLGGMLHQLQTQHDARCQCFTGVM